MPVAAQRRQTLTLTPCGDVCALPVRAPTEEGGLLPALSPSALPVRVPAVDLGRALTNLVDNAMKYAPEGAAIEVRLARSGAMAEIAVTDTGPGIPPAQMHRIFERFFRVDRARSVGGAGLGLAITRHLVERHGGHIVAENAPQGGARITLRFPLWQGSSG